MVATLAVALVALVPFPPQDPQPPPAAAATYDLSCTIRVAEPVYVTTRMTTKGSLRVKRGAVSQDLAIERSTSIEHLDEFTSFDRPMEGDFLAARRYVKWHVEERRLVRDPEWNGTWLRLGIVDGKDSVQLEERGVRRTVLDVEVQRIEFVGAWLPLPKGAAVGERVEIDPQALGHLMHFIDAPVEGKSELVLAGVSPERIATISGPLEFTRHLEDEGLDEIHRGKCTLSVDLAERKLIRVEWKGDFLMLDPGLPQRYTGKVPFKCELAVLRGDAARKAGDAKSVQRERDWLFETAKLDFELPSHWFDSGGQDPMMMLFESALYGIDNSTQLEFKLVDVGKGGADTTMDALLHAWRDDKSLKIREERSTTCALGRGKVLRIENDAKNEITIGLYPCGEHWLLRVRLIAPPGKGKEIAPTWTRLEKSLRRPK